MTPVARYLDERLIEFLQVNHRDEAVSTLVDLLDREGRLHDKDRFLRAIWEREKIVSTGIGIGVAVPHAKLEGYGQFFIAIGIQKGKGIEWNALDGSMVRLVFMIGGPSNQQTEYLKILSHLTAAIKEETRRKQLLKAQTRREVVSLFEGC